VNIGYHGGTFSLLAFLFLMIRFFILFTVLLVGMFTLEILQPAEKYVIMPFTSSVADISVWIIQFFDDGVIARANVIKDVASGFGVRIERSFLLRRFSLSRRLSKTS